MAPTPPSDLALARGRRHRAVREARGLSQLKLSYAMYEKDVEEHRGYDPSFIARVETGHRAPPARYWLLVGRTLAPTLEEFPEYYLGIARRALDETELGLDQALANLAALSPTETPDDVLRRAGAELEQNLAEEIQRSRPSTARSAASKRASANG